MRQLYLPSMWNWPNFLLLIDTSYQQKDILSSSSIISFLRWLYWLSDSLSWRNYCNKKHTSFSNSSKNWVNEWRKYWFSLLLTHRWILATLTWSRRLKKINNAAYRGIWIMEGLWLAKHLIFFHHQKQYSLVHLQFYKNQQEWVGGLIFNSGTCRNTIMATWDSARALAWDPPDIEFSGGVKSQTPPVRLHRAHMLLWKRLPMWP